MIRYLSTLVTTAGLIGASSVRATEQNRAIVTKFARLFYIERHVREAFMPFVAADFVWDDPGIPDGDHAVIYLLGRGGATEAGLGPPTSTG
jgi:hypothetical protein